MDHVTPGLPASAGGRDPRFGDPLVPLEEAYRFLPADGDRSGPVVGVVDTGLLLPGGQPPPWFRGELDGIAAQQDTGDPTDRGGLSGHGSFVGALILQEAPQARLAVRRAIQDGRDGIGEDRAVGRAIRELGARGVQLINLSFTGEGAETAAPEEILAALAGLPAETVVVAAAGNDASHREAYPGCVELGPGRARVIAVGALDLSRGVRRDDPPKVAGFSNYGPWVDVYAGGVGVLGPDVKDPLSGRAALWSGTSFAAALVTGRIARLAADAGRSVREAAEAVLNPPESGHLEVWTVNGPQRAPYLRATLTEARDIAALRLARALTTAPSR